MKKKIGWFLLFYSLVVLAKAVPRPTTKVTVGQTYQYSFDNGALTPDASWVISGNGVILSEWQSGTTYFAMVRWDVAGTASLKFYGLSLLNTQNFTVNAPTLSTPVASTATNVGLTSFTGNWSAAAGATGYRISVGMASPNVGFVAAYNNLDIGNVTTYNVTGLSEGVTYYYIVSAYNTTGASSNSSSVTVVTPPPAPVTNVMGAITANSFMASWGSATSATGYALDIATDNSFTTLVPGYSNLNVGNVTNYAVTGLAGNTSYYLRVRALAGTAISVNSNTVTALTIPATPVAYAPTIVTNSSFDLSVTGLVGGYLAYEVSTNDAFATFVANAAVDELPFTVGRLLANTIYYYRVRVLNASGYSEYSNVVMVTTLPVPPDALAATDVTPSSFTANWSSIAGVTKYRLDVATDISFTNLVGIYNNLLVNAATQSVTGLAGGTTYYYRVRTGNRFGNASPNSNTITTTTLLSSPTASAPTDLSPSSFTVNWESVGNAASYQLDVALTDSFTSFVGIYNNLSVASTSQTVSGLTDGTMYYYRVRAVNGANVSANSNTVSVTSLLMDAPAVSATSATICWGQSALFTATAGSNGTKVMWYTGSGTYLSEGNSFSISPHPRAPITTQTTTTYFAKTCDDNICSSTTQTNFTVTVNPMPPSILFGGSSMAYISGQVNLSVEITEVVPPNSILRWYDVPTDGTPVADVDVFAAFQTPVLYAPKSYYAAIRNNSTGCENPQRLEVVANIKVQISAAKVITDRVRTSGIKTTAQIDALTDAQRTTQITHIDGLQRVSQQVVVRGSPLGKDIVQPTEYDDNGRSTKNYLPYVAPSSDGSFRTYYATEQSTFYTAANDKVANDNYPYAVLKYEASPLGRLVEQGGAGQVWQPDKGHTTIVKYSYNTGATASEAEEVRKFNADGTSTSFYAANTLSRIETKDPQGNKQIEFFDGAGRQVATKKQLDQLIGGVMVAYLQTYYIYDDFSRVKFIVSPKGVVALRSGAWSFTTSIKDNYCNQFIYDARGRLVEKKIPGQAWLYYLYDKLNRLVLMQDGLQRTTFKWTFFKYDLQGQLVMQGVYTHGSQPARSVMQSTIADVLYSPTNSVYPASAFYETRGTTLHGYSNISFPKANANGTALLVTLVKYYESYDFDFNGVRDFKCDTLALAAEGQLAYSNWRAKGLPTGAKRLVLNTTGWLYDYVFYDDYNRPIQVRSNNHLSAAIDNLTTTVYDFEGKALVTKKYHKTAAATTVLNRFVYDSQGRLVQVKQSNNAAPEQVIAKYEYNELGQLVDKKLHQVTANNYLQSVDYRYTIRGQLASINNAKLANDALNNDETNDYFGMELFYNTTESGLATSPLYNGNVSAIKWKTVGTGSTTAAGNQKSYAYTFDKAGQLRTADYKMHNGTNWTTKEVGVHNETATYDHNGNILTMVRNQRKHQLTGLVASYVSEAMDNLTYTYNAGNGNSLEKVTDAGTTNGFNNGTSGTANDYTYDANGNAQTDNNKGISSIVYNVLGKAQSITFTDGRVINYTYDGAGTKLKMAVKVGTVTATTDYVGDFVYTNNALSFFGAPEGRVVVKGSAHEYQYNIADHQGNTRVVFSSIKPAPAAITATFDGGTADNSNQFTNVDPSFVVANGSANYTPGGVKVVRMNQSYNTGPAKSLKVYPGDKVDMETYAYYEDASGYGSSNNTAAAMVTSIAAAFGGVSGGTGESGNIFSGINNALSAVGLAPNQGDGVPSAYLNYILFDQQYKLLDMGWTAVPSTANFAKQKISIPQITIKEAGFLFVYLSYETLSNNWVYFDNFKVTHTKTNIVQYNEYYPFGLQASTSWTREHSTNNFLYNSGAELNTTSGLYDTFYRGFDPALGRFMQVDPLAHEYHSVTPYQYALNNPALLNDPNGDKVSQFSPARNAYLSRYAASWHQTTSNDGSMAHDLADAFYDANTFEGGGSSAPSEGDFFKTTLIATENATGFTYVMQVYHTSDEIIEVFASSVYESMGGYVAHYGNEYSWSGAALSGVMSAAQQTQGGGATVYIENDGIGHAYIEVNGTVFSYGRYDGSYSPMLGAFGPIGPGVLNKKGHSYADERMSKSPTTIYRFPTANADVIYKYLNDAYNAGTPGKNGGMVIDTYLLVGNNCTTITCGALREGGIIIPMINTPAGFRDYMESKAGAMSNNYINSLGQH